MMMEEKWDSESMATKQARLAHQLLSNAPHDQVQEGVIEFFESLAMLEGLSLVHKELVWNACSFHSSRWWTACREYILG